MSAIGGENVTTTVEGRERYPVNVRYGREYRENIPGAEARSGSARLSAQIPMEQIADLRLLEGPSMIRNENGQLAGYVYVDMAGRDMGSYVEDAKRLVSERVELRRATTRSGAGSTRTCCACESA
jgi:Cu(I)/Ag(I) efflux system membrane protein CusA/SilA